MSRTLHIGKDGTPKTCIAKPGNCPLANPLAHFQEAEKAQEFADRYNELKAEGMEYAHLDPEKDIEKLENAELIYISEHIKENAEENDNYSDFYNQIRWQKTQRNNALKEMIARDEENREILENLERLESQVEELHESLGDFENSVILDNGSEIQIVGKSLSHIRIVDSRGTIYKPSEYFSENPNLDQSKKAAIEQGLSNRKLKINKYYSVKQMLNQQMEQAKETTAQNKAAYEKAYEKKKKHEETMIGFMEKKIRNQTIKEIESSVDSEIKERVSKYLNEVGEDA